MAQVPLCLPLLSLGCWFSFSSFCHLSSPRKRPFSGASVISSCVYIRGRMGSNGLGQVGQCQLMANWSPQSPRYCRFPLSAPRPMGLSPQKSPGPLPAAWVKAQRALFPALCPTFSARSRLLRSCFSLQPRKCLLKPENPFPPSFLWTRLFFAFGCCTRAHAELASLGRGLSKAKANALVIV